MGCTLAAFAPGLLLFTVHYLMLRGFYAQEDTRTPFLVQLVVSPTNVAAALLLTLDAPTDQIATRLAFAYGIAYLAGSAASTTAAVARLGGLGGRPAAGVHRAADRGVRGGGRRDAGRDAAARPGRRRRPARQVRPS